MATATLPRKAPRRKVRSITRWDIYLIDSQGSERLVSSDLDDAAKAVYLDSMPRWHRSDERIEARQIRYTATGTGKAESRPGKVICGPNGPINLKELRREDTQRMREFNARLRDMFRAEGGDANG